MLNKPDDKSGRPAAGISFPSTSGEDKYPEPQPCQQKPPVKKSSATAIKLGIIAKLQTKISRLSAPPFSFAIVADIFKQNNPLPTDFVAGSLVTVVSGPYQGQTGLIAESADENGVVKVQLDQDSVVEFHLNKGKNRVLELLGRAKQTAVIIADNKFLEVSLPDDLAIQPGDTVKINFSTLQIVDVSPMKFGGEIVSVSQVLSDKLIRVDLESAQRVILSGKFGTLLKPGDKVLIDGSASIVLEKIDSEERQFVFALSTNVDWNDVVGNDDAKNDLREAVETAYLRPEIFTALNKKPPKGALLFGPPGVGKTMLVKALATALQKLHGNAKGCLVYLKGPEILRGIVGDTETIVRQLFQQARDFKAKNGFPAVIFIDEAEAILSKRGSGISSDVDKTIVPAFLAEMDGLEDSGAIVILATNRPDMLDPAVVRDGRIDLKIKIDRPTPEAVKLIFLKHLVKIKLEETETADGLAQFATTEFFSPARILYEIKTRSDTKIFTLGHIANGAMIVSGVIGKATSLALRRAIAEKCEPCLKREDLLGAINSVQQQNEQLDNNDAIAEFVRDFKHEVVDIKPLQQGKH